MGVVPAPLQPGAPVLKWPGSSLLQRTARARIRQCLHAWHVLLWELYREEHPSVCLVRVLYDTEISFPF